jgi:hypothetical protein
MYDLKHPLMDVCELVIGVDNHLPFRITHALRHHRFRLGQTVSLQLAECREHIRNLSAGPC